MLGIAKSILYSLYFIKVNFDITHHYIVVILSAIKIVICSGESH